MYAIIECEMPVDRAMPTPAGYVGEQLFWSECVAPAIGVTSGITVNAAPADDAVPSIQPHITVHVFAPTSGLFVAIGANPDATNPAARRWLRAGETHRFVLPNGHRVAWSTN